MSEVNEFYVKDSQLETDGGQGMVRLTVGPMGIKDARKLAIVTAGGKLKVVLE